MKAVPVREDEDGRKSVNNVGLRHSTSTVEVPFSLISVNLRAKAKNNVPKIWYIKIKVVIL